MPERGSRRKEGVGEERARDQRVQEAHWRARAEEGRGERSERSGEREGRGHSNREGGREGVSVDGLGGRTLGGRGGARSAERLRGPREDRYGRRRRQTSTM